MCGSNLVIIGHACRYRQETSCMPDNNSVAIERTGEQESSQGEKEILTDTERQAGDQTNKVTIRGRLQRTNKHGCMYCIDNDMVLEMKAETMQMALTRCSYHDDQPPELGGKSRERSAGGRGGTGEERVSWFHSFPSLPRVVPALCDDVSETPLPEKWTVNELFIKSTLLCSLTTINELPHCNGLSLVSWTQVAWPVPCPPWTYEWPHVDPGKASCVCLPHYYSSFYLVGKTKTSVASVMENVPLKLSKQQH